VRLFDWFRGGRRPSPAAEPVGKTASLPGLKVPLAAVARSRVPKAAPVNPFLPARHPAGVAPAGASLAMDEQVVDSLGWTNGAYPNGQVGEGLYFLGYPYLAELAQRPEYRKISEIIATEMVRKWIRVTASGEEDKSERISAINAALDRFGVRDAFREIAEQDGFFGRAHLYVDLEGGDEPIEAQTSIGAGRDSASAAKVGKGKLKGFKTVEAVWCYPSGYNTTNPLAADWYKPALWYVQGRPVHATRLLTFVGREVPDLLKPAYSFGGLSMSQMAKPYVDNWLRTRASVADLISSFSTSGVKIDMAAMLTGGGDDSGDAFFRRIDLFTNLRDNRNTMVLNKAVGTEAAEEFFNVSTPLGTLDTLQAQTQEHMAAVSGVPLIKLLGISPAGLNASSEGEIRTFYDSIHSFQERFYGPHLRTVIDIVQLNEFGDVDPDIGYEFEPLWSMDAKEAAEVRDLEARTAQTYIDSGVLLPEDERKRIATAKDTPYQGLDLSIDVGPPGLSTEMPEPPEPGERPSLEAAE